jgi:hypothetical protein
MDVLLGRVTQQAMNYAIRSGVAITASYAIRQSGRFLKTTPKSDARDELERLHQKLQHKIYIISPAIDLIELIAARGNTSLESAVSLVKELRLQIQALGQRWAKAAEASEQLARNTATRSRQGNLQNEAELALFIKDFKSLLNRIEDAVPLINLAITTSGASLSTRLPQTVSPSRLLQASTFLTAGDTQYSMSPAEAVQIGPTFTLTIYMLFAGHNRPQDEEELRETTWKEVIHKAQVKLRRVPLDAVIGDQSSSKDIAPAEISSPVKLPTSQTGRQQTPDGASPHIRASTRSDEYAYQLLLVEDFDDDRVHDFSDESELSRPTQFDDVTLAGIRETIPVHEVAKIFYADTSKVLNIGTDAESNHPVLLLKRDLNAVPPRRMMESKAPYEELRETPDESQDATQEQHAAATNAAHDPWRFPPSLDPEWIAFEVYSEAEPSDSESDFEDSTTDQRDLTPSELAKNLSQIHLKSPSPSPSPSQPQPQPQHRQPLTPSTPWTSKVQTSLSLLELLLRLTSLQQFQQQSHLSINDELLTFFLEESASTGAGGDERYRQQLRQEARRRVGWDPYDESPVKRRGEEYQYGHASDYDSPGARSAGRATTAAQEGEAQWSPANPSRSERNRHLYQDSMSPSPAPASSPVLPSPSSPIPAFATGKPARAAWLRREGDSVTKKGSPLRPHTAMTDEGLGTSPASAGLAGNK